MGQSKNLLDLAASGNAVEFRQAFADQMRAKMAERIVFSNPEPTPAPSAPVVATEETISDENVIAEAEEGKKKALNKKEEDIAKKAFTDGKKVGKGQKEVNNSDLFIFGASEEAIKKAKEIVANFNDSHPDDELEVRVYRNDAHTKFYVAGPKVNRLQVRALIRTVGGKYQTQKV